MSATQSQLDAAVAAYLANEKLSIIRSSLGAQAMMLYRELDRRGIGRRSHGWCEWCGDSIPSGRKRFCSKRCNTDYNADISDVDMSCLVCGGRVVRVEDDVCSDTCRSVIAERHSKQDLRSVRLYTKGDLHITEIARLMGKSVTYIKDLQDQLLVLQHVAKSRGAA